ncbi:PTS sugar transporter subunit IIB [Sporolactobacillus laevolacticus]|nr:PTS sugar transporter subunit IIB [Sporolactobacillus laevolacticus]MDN3955609.1 PTS sugar transporter subunit IIB [Sporolactobacillus laevolacticus]
MDNRLIHGQIAVNWKTAYKVETIVVPDDRLMNDGINKYLMQLTGKTANVKVIFTKIENVFQKVNDLPNKSTLVLCRSLSELKEIVNKGFQFEEVSLWNMYKTGTKKKIFGSVYMDDEDLQNVAFLKEKGIKVFIQETPYSKKINL